MPYYDDHLEKLSSDNYDKNVCIWSGVCSFLATPVVVLPASLGMAMTEHHQSFLFRLN